MIKLICDYRDGVTAVPTDILDKHLKLAPAASFKVLLFVMRNPGGDYTAETVAACTGMSVQDACDCLEYWKMNGVLEITDGSSQEGNKAASGNTRRAESQSGAPSERQKAVRPLPVSKPTQRQIAARLAEEPELSVIYGEAQKILGTFGYDTQALILMIYDYYGFPPEVIITLLQHHKQLGKLSSAAIKSTAEDWAKRGIDTLELVEKELLALEKIKTAYTDIKASAGLSAENPTPRIKSLLRDWAVEREISSALIIFALQESGNSFTEANKLLKKWSAAGLTSPEQVRQRKTNNIPTDVKKTYDINKIGKNSILESLKQTSERADEQ